VGRHRGLGSALLCVLAAEVCWSVLTILMSSSSGNGDRGNALSSRWLASQGLPIAIVSITVLTCNKIDVPLIGFFRTSGEVAAYWGAYNLLFAAMAVAALLARAALPQMSRQAGQAEAGGVDSTFRLALITGMLGCFIATVLAGFPNAIMDAAYAGRLREGARALEVLALALPAHFLGAILVGRLVAEKRQHLWAAAAVSGASINLGLNLILIPRLGIVGAGWATVASEWLLLMIVLVAFRVYQLHRAFILNAAVMVACFVGAALLVPVVGASLGPLGVAGVLAMLCGCFAVLGLQRVPKAMQLVPAGEVT